MKGFFFSTLQVEVLVPAEVTYFYERNFLERKRGPEGHLIYERPSSALQIFSNNTCWVFTTHIDISSFLRRRDMPLLKGCCEIGSSNSIFFKKWLSYFSPKCHWFLCVRIWKISEIFIWKSVKKQTAEKNSSNVHHVTISGQKLRMKTSSAFFSQRDVLVFAFFRKVSQLLSEVEVWSHLQNWKFAIYRKELKRQHGIRELCPGEAVSQQIWCCFFQTLCWWIRRVRISRWVNDTRGWTIFRLSPNLFINELTTSPPSNNREVTEGA